MVSNFLPAKPKGGIAHPLSRPRVISNNRRKKITRFNGIAKFIQGSLIPLLRDNAATFEILLERDLEYWIFHHLLNVIDPKLFHIHGNKTLSGMSNGTIAKSKVRFTMPDQMIRDLLGRIGIIFEMKSDKANQNGAYLHRKSSQNEFMKDFTKMNKYFENQKLMKNLRHGFFIYIYRDPDLTESEIKKEISKHIHHKRIIPIVINRYWDAKNDRFYSQRKMDQISAEFREYDYIYVGSKNGKPAAKKKALTTKQRSVIAKKCWHDSPKLIAKMLPETRKAYFDSRKTFGLNIQSR